MSSAACKELIRGWRREARRFREVQETECERHDDEWYIYDADASRLELCAEELEAALAAAPLSDDAYDVYSEWYQDHRGRPFTGTREQWQAWRKAKEG